MSRTLFLFGVYAVTDVSILAILEFMHIDSYASKIHANRSYVY